MFARSLLMLGLFAATTFAANKVERPAPGKAGDFNPVKLTVDGLAREYRLVVPKTVDLEKPAPLLVAFHGMLIDSKDLMPLYTKLSDAARKHQYLIAYPNAIGGSWGLSPANVQRDLNFFDALVKDIGTDYKLDPDRLYVCGMSNGGYFAHLTAKERSTTIAAAASHSGPLGLQTLLGVNAKRKFPVMIIHGDQDRILKVEFARENRDKYRREGHEVLYIELKGEGHMWGKNVNAQLFKFFDEHPRETKK